MDNTKSKKRNKNKNKKKQQKVKGNMPGQPFPVRTPGTIINSLAAPMKRAPKVSPYVHCRLFSVAPSEVPSLPDGNNGRHICVCLFKSDRITFTGTGSRSVDMYFAPILPCPLLLRPTGNVSINNVTPLGQYYPLGVAPEYGTGIALTRPGATSIDPHSSPNGRIISMTTEIIYTGPVTTCAGLIRVTPSLMGFSGTQEMTGTSANTTAPTAGMALGLTNFDLSAPSWAPISTNALELEFSALPQSARPNTRSFRPEQGAVVRLRHRTSDYKMRPCYDMTLGAVNRGAFATNASQNINVTNLITDDNISFGGGIRLVDEDWESQIIMLDNVNADGSYIINTCVCMEFSPTLTSPLYPLARQPTRTDNASMNIIEAAQKRPEYLADSRITQAISNSMNAMHRGE